MTNSARIEQPYIDAIKTAIKDASVNGVIFTPKQLCAIQDEARREMSDAAMRRQMKEQS
jgi:hypothetical protein